MIVSAFGQHCSGGQAIKFQILADFKADRKGSLSIDHIKRKVTVHHKSLSLKYLKDNLLAY
ncbi:hypothetical protein [Chryseobacterium sp. Leaf404]|uniref:hypothetical protein n=1 Tax=Chryseobacterium sp. Leaf404 TaxID=1736366 RepID=UPI000A8B15D3|nr:hypothetical protein [Chryseobacterium sp. Leaf404]